MDNIVRIEAAPVTGSRRVKALVAALLCVVYMPNLSGGQLEIPGCLPTVGVQKAGFRACVRRCSTDSRRASAGSPTYTKEEIRQEGMVRHLPPFLRFLAAAGQLNGQVVNGQSLARDTGIGRSTVDAYLSILTDTWLGSFLPAWQLRIRSRERTHPKFHWFDSGVARAAAGLLDDRPDRVWLGTALETYLLHECRVRNAVSGQARGLYYYGLAAGSEIDLVVETRRAQPAAPARVATIEIKLAEKWDRKWERAARELAASRRVEVERMIGVYTGPRAYVFDGFEVLPVDAFVRELHAGKVF